MIASTNAAIGPLPEPCSSRISPSTYTFTVSWSFSPAAEEVCTEFSFSGVSRVRYSCWKASQIAAAVISPPSPSVCSCTARLNSICSRRGRSSLCSDFIT